MSLDFWEEDQRKVYTTLVVSGLFLASLVWFLLFQIRRIEQQNIKIKDNEERLEVMAKTDHLTGMYNRRAFYEAAKYQLTKAEENKTLLSLVLMDIDHFKKINDIYGHDEGDRVLEAMATILSSMTREGDMVARYGGEEFILLLPGSSMEQSYQIAERTRERISKEVSVRNNQKITISLGVAEYVHEESIDTLIKRADEALYKAKGAGRNRTEM